MICNWAVDKIDLWGTNEEVTRSEGGTRQPSIQLYEGDPIK